MSLPIDRVRARNFTAQEDTVIMTMVAGHRRISDMANLLDRSEKGIAARIALLRRDGVIPGHSPRRRNLENIERRVNMDPALTLKNDDLLVRAALREGGFPQAVVTAHGTAWAAPDGMPWRYGRQIGGEA